MIEEKKGGFSKFKSVVEMESEDEVFEKKKRVGRRKKVV